MPGPPKEPTALRLLKNNRGKRSINHDEPEPAMIEDVSPPSALVDPAEQAKWHDVVSKFHATGVFTLPDTDVLIDYCRTYVELERYRSKLKEFGELLKSPHGGFVTNPFVRMRDRAADRCLKLQIQMGMTPSSRSAIRVSSGGGVRAPKQSKLARFLASKQQRRA